MAGQLRIPFATSSYDRVAYHRVDDEWLRQAWASPQARAITLAGSRVLTNGAVVWRSPGETPYGVRVLLGETDEHISFAVLGAADLAVDDTWVGLRGLLGIMDADEAPYIAHAVGLAEWHRAVRHCPRCGAALESRSAGHVLHCAECGRDQFPRTDPAVIMLITDGEDRALLGRQPIWPAGRWSTLAGFVEPGETLEDAVRREVFEESGVVVGEVDYVGSQPWPLPASLMLGFVGRATTTDIRVDGDELEAARWWSRDEMRAALDSGEVVVPAGVSISRSLILGWYGEEISTSW